MSILFRTICSASFAHPAQKLLFSPRRLSICGKRMATYSPFA